MRAPIRHQMLLGILWMLLASTLFAVGNALVKSVTPNVPFWEAVFARAAFALVAVVLANLRRPRVFLGVNRRVLVLRGLLGTAALSCYYYSITSTHLGVATMLAHTSPIFVVVFAATFLRERVGKGLAALVVVGFTGIGLILAPSVASFDTSALVAVAAAAFAGGAYTNLRHLRRTDQPATIVFYYAFFSTLVSLPFFLWTYRAPSGPEILTLLFVGVTSTLAQFALTYAYSFAAAAVVSPFSYWTVLVSYVYGVTLFGEVPTWAALAGSLVVAASGIAIGLTEGRTAAPDGDHASISDARKI
jgi:drug/metabolite transporter (DMT)-like permease